MKEKSVISELKKMSGIVMGVHKIFKEKEWELDKTILSLLISH